MMIQQVNSINIGGDGEGGGSSRLVLKHLDVVKDTVEELKDTLSGASALVIATGFVPGNPLKMNVAAHEVDNVGTCKLIVSAQTKYYIYIHILRYLTYLGVMGFLLLSLNKPNVLDLHSLSLKLTFSLTLSGSLIYSFYIAMCPLYYCTCRMLPRPWVLPR